MFSFVRQSMWAADPAERLPEFVAMHEVSEYGQVYGYVESRKRSSEPNEISLKFIALTTDLEEIGSYRDRITAARATRKAFKQRRCV